MKKIYELLNDVSVDTDTYEQTSLTDAEKQRILRRFPAQKPQRQFFRKSAIAVAAALLVIVPVVFNQDVVRASVVKIGKQIESFFNKQEGSFVTYKQQIGESVTEQGVCVTLNEILLDNDNLLLSVNVNEAGSAKGPFKPGSLQVKIDDQIYDQNTGYGLQSLGTSNVDGSFDYLYMKPLSGFIDSFDANRDYNIEITFKSMEYEKLAEGESSVSRLTGSHGNVNQESGEVEGGRYSDYFGEIQGEWAFKTVIKGERILADNNTYPIDQVIPIDAQGIQGVLQIKNVRISPLMVQLRYTFELSEISQSLALPTIDVGFEVLDENGEGLTGSSGGSGTDTFWEMEGEYYLSDDQKTVKLLPYIHFDTSTDDVTYLYDKTVEIDLQSIE